MSSIRVALPFLLVVLPASIPPAFGGEAPVPLSVGQTLEQTLYRGAPRLYSLALAEGETARGEVLQKGIDVVVRLRAPDGRQIAEIDSPNGDDGPEPFSVTAEAAGTYLLEVVPFDEGPESGAYSIRWAQRLSRADLEAEKALERERLRAASDWFAANAVRLFSVKAGSGFADLEPLRAMIGDARLVALGEATHGTREFFQLKHRLLEFLVSEMGFTAFAIEANLPEAFDVDRWVTTGEGDPVRALAGLYFWTWNTEEVMDLLEWMRAWNADPKHARKIRFYGVDMQVPTRAAERALAGLRAVEPALANRLAKALEPMLTEIGFEDTSRELPESVAGLAAAAQELEAALATREEALARSLPAEESRRALRSARVLVQFFEMSSKGAEGGLVRDRAMAENALWALGEEGPAGKVVLWAHNGHVEGGDPAAPESMGDHLRRELGDGLRVVGFAFSEGAFQAKERVGSRILGLTTFNVDEAPAEWLDGVLAASGVERAVVDLRRLPTSGPVSEWWSTRPSSRSIGAVFAAGLDAAFSAPSPSGRFDLLAFVRRTSAARSLSGMAVRYAPTSVFESPEKFEQGERDGLPALWNRTRAGDPGGYRTELRGDGGVAGSRAVCVEGHPSGRYGAAAGGVWRDLAATPFAGRSVRVGASARLSGDMVAVLDVATTKLGFPAPGLPWGKSAAKRTPGWQHLETTVAIPEGVSEVRVSLLAEGRGEACFDDVTLEVVPEAK